MEPERMRSNSPNIEYIPSSSWACCVFTVDYVLVGSLSLSMYMCLCVCVFSFQSDTYSWLRSERKKKNSIAIAVELKYSWRSFLISSHFVFAFAFDSIFYPSAFYFFSRTGPKPHCVLFRLQIGLSLLVFYSHCPSSSLCVCVCGLFLHEFHFTLVHSVWCPLVGNIPSSWLFFTATFSSLLFIVLPYSSCTSRITL